MPRTAREWKIFPISVRELEVLRVVDLSGGMRRITLGGDQLAGYTTDDGIEVPPLRTEGFDDHVKIIVPDTGQQRAIPPRQVEGHLDWSEASPGKDYTPRRFDLSGGELDLDFVRHEVGLAWNWAAQASVGDRLHLAGPKSSALMPEGFDWLLVGGDETALPAIARMLEEWPAGTRGQVFIEVARKEHRLPVRVPDGVEVTWLVRDGVSAGQSTLLVDAVKAAPWWEGRVFCWFAGEAVSLKPLRPYLKNERQLPADCWEVTGYWRRREVTTTDAAGGGGAIKTAPSPESRARALLDPTGGIAIRAAAAVGLFDRLELGAATATVLAAELGLGAARPAFAAATAGRSPGGGRDR